MNTPETRYARSGKVRIAYQVVGQGSFDLVFVPGFISNLEVHWEDAGYSLLMKRLATFSRLIIFDKRGAGLSDRVDADQLPSLETRLDDVRAVMEAAGSGRAALLGASEGAPMAILFAATYPERTRALALYGGYAHFHTWVMSPDALETFIENVETSWGSGATLANFAPERGEDARFKSWWGRLERLSASPTAAAALCRMNALIDVRHILSSIRVPTAIIHRAGDVRVKPSAGRYLAEKIAGARLIEIPGRDHPIWTGDIDRIADEIQEFLTGARPAPHRDRALSTLLVARLVAPERIAARLGDLRWSERMDRLRKAASITFAQFGGLPVGVGAENIIARFDRPALAVRCAVALRDASGALGLGLAVGVHIGEIEIHEDSIAGLALHVAERISTRAKAGDVLVSSIVTDLVAGSGLHFEDRGSETIDGMEGALRLLAVAAEEHLQPLVRPQAEPSLTSLSEREHEVLAFIAEGLSNSAIAGRLRLSEHTIKRHVANILLKLDLPTRAAAAAHAGRRAL